MASTVWKGHLTFGLVSLPVKLYSAARSETVSFNQLHKHDHSRVKQVLYCALEDKPIQRSEIVKGYEYEDGKYVVLGEEDFRRANPEASRTVDIVAFVEMQDVAPIYFETPYYLAPSRRGEKAYALLRETLKKAGKAGIATVVIRTKQYLAALFAQDDILVLNTLRYADELKKPASLEIAPAKVTAKELDMALRLVEDMSDEWQPGKFHDTYREDILKRVEAKIKAGETEEIPEPERPKERKGGEVIDLMSLLKKSIEKKPEKRTARKKQRRAA